MQDYGAKYAIQYKDLSKRDPNDIGMSSGFGTLKTHISGVVSKSAAAGALTIVEVPHGLGYRPSFNGYFRDPTNGEVYPIASGFEDVSFNRSGSVVNVHGKSNNYNLVLAIYNTTAGALGVDIFYEVFYEDLVSEPIFISPF